jgi:hypothetical protein
MFASRADRSLGPEPGWNLCPLTPREAALAYPLLLALERPAETLGAWQARVVAWLRRRPSERCNRGIMTLRNGSGVIAGLFFYAETCTLDATTLIVERLRVVEPVGGWQGLGVTLRVLDGFAQEHGCGGIVLRGEAGSPAWAHIAEGLAKFGQQAGFVRRGLDWARDDASHSRE